MMKTISIEDYIVTDVSFVLRYITQNYENNVHVRLQQADHTANTIIYLILIYH